MENSTTEMQIIHTIQDTPQLVSASTIAIVSDQETKVANSLPLFTPQHSTPTNSIQETIAGKRRIIVNCHEFGFIYFSISRTL